MNGIFVENIFKEVLTQSASASWLILVVILIRAFLKKVPKSLRYVLWAFVAIRLLCPVFIESNWSLLPDIEISSKVNTADTHMSTVPIKDVETLEQSGSTELSPNQQVDVHDFIIPNQEAEEQTIDSVPEKIENDLPEKIVGITDRETEKNTFSIQKLLPVMLWVWMIGIFTISFSSIISFLRLKRKVSASLQIGENVWVCDEIQSPFIFGMVLPCIYVPSFVTKEQLPYVLAHENEHLRYHDHWWKPIGFAILILHWVNPLVWVAYTLFCRDIELACDERVIRHMDEEEKKQYSKSLLLCSNQRYMIFACPVAFGEIGVKERIKSILNYKKPSTWIIGIGVCICIIIAVCFMTNPKTEKSGLNVENTEDKNLLQEFSETEDSTENGVVVSADPNLNKYLAMQTGEALSKEEIEWFETEFFNTEENRMPNMFLTSFYDKPENINLDKLFYGGADGFGGGEITEEEKELLQKTYYAEEDGLLDVFRTTTDEMNIVLRKYMNVSLEDTNKIALQNLNYLSKYDAYYKVAGDTEYAQYHILGGWKNEDGTISLVYGQWAISVTMYYQVTLTQDGDNYYFLSNLQLPIDLSVVTAKEITEEEALQATSDVDGQIYTSMLDEQKGYVLHCSSPAAGLMSKVLCKTSDGGTSFENYMDISNIKNYPAGVYFFAEDIGYIITDYHCSDSFLYRTEDGGRTWTPQAVYIPGSWYRYVNGIGIENGVLQIEVVLDDTSLYYEYITNDMGETWDIVWSRSLISEMDDEIVTYNGKKYKKSELCGATLRWLELSEQERFLSSYIPPEFHVFVENLGIALSADDITSTSITLRCTQSGGNPTGELQTGSWYILEEWTQEYGWMEVDNLPQEYTLTWTQEAWRIPMNGTCEWEVNWEWLYGMLPEGKYRIGKNITDFRSTGDYDEAVYYAEFEILE